MTHRKSVELIRKEWKLMCQRLADQGITEVGIDFDSYGEGHYLSWAFIKDDEGMKEWTYGNIWRTLEP